MELPPHCEIGSATAQGNNCLIHSIVQLALPDLSWRGGEQAASGIRHQPAKEKRCPKHAYLELEKWRQPILREIGKNPSDYRVSRYNKASGAQFHGSGHINMVLFDEGFSHFAPVWRGGRGAGDGSRPPQQNLPEYDGPSTSPGDLDGPGGETALPQNPS